jgi:hypothetical protein
VPKSSQIHLHVTQLELGFQECRFPWAFSKHKHGMMLGITWQTTCLTIWCISNHLDVQVLWYHAIYFLPFSLFSIIRSLAIATLPWMLALWSPYQTIFVETGSTKWILNSAVTFDAVVLWFLDTILFNVWWSLSLSFGFQPLFLSADDVYPWFVYAFITLELLLWYRNKVSVWLQMLKLNVHQQSVLLENLTSLPFCGIFIRTVTKHNL